MNSRIKNIVNLTKIFLKNSFIFPYLIDKKNNKINKKSLKAWFIIIILVTVTYLSYVLIKELAIINQAGLFLNFMLLLLTIVLLFQTTITSTNIYYFSKDLELILPLPINPIDLLISKLNVNIINTYFSELIFILFPLIIYGIYISSGIAYYIYTVILLVIFPILPVLIVSIISMFLMKLSRFAKNKDIFQIVITFILVVFIIIVLFNLIKTIIVPSNGVVITDEENITGILKKFNNKLKKINTNFLQINPSIELLNNSNKINSLINLFKIVLIDGVFFIFFIFIGKITYLKNILKNNIFNTAKKINKINLKKKCKNKNIVSTYISKEFKILFKTPIYFIQFIYPTIIMIISLMVIAFVALPNLKVLSNSEILGNYLFEINLNIIFIIIAGIQILLTFSNISSTAISREGKNAKFMKYIPIDFYKQIIYKSMPQIILNSLFTLFICILIFLFLPKIKILYVVYIFIISSILNSLISILMVVLDLIDPNLNWSSEHEVISKNNKKLYQYVFTILIVLFLNYFYKIFGDLNINIASILMILILLIILFILNFIINKYKNKLFKKIE